MKCPANENRMRNKQNMPIYLKEINKHVKTLFSVHLKSLNSTANVLNNCPEDIASECSQLLSRNSKQQETARGDINITVLFIKYFPMHTALCRQTKKTTEKKKKQKKKTGIQDMIIILVVHL